ncbi:hypothetical protein EJ08DRAFT_211220 [Tothia fuscella]|uniref:Potassium channel tetramerisation-type BTB domain-containing protein n=1 Tax=Tothia fuscella TaxID=1048955 RepID=A0A9P4NRK1_9PEZI|nr:hypothetical protein EJ08DRAFT_211220 [Tothia fuscella]
MTVPSNHSTTTAQTMAEPSSTRPTVPTRAGSKRKADSSPSSSSKQQGQAADPSPPKRASMARPPQPGKSQSSRLTRSQANVDDDDVDDDDDDGDVEPTPRRETGNLQRSESTSKKNAEAAAANRTRRIVEMNKLTTVLPAGKVFPIQIGSELFRLSGASISSDAPSYFSHYFGEQLIQTGGRASQVKTLYIDRDPATFRDIGLHLQGYFVKPRDEEHFVRLFADAQFYSLPRLTQQLFKSEIFIQVGDRHFQIPRDIFSGPGDSPNFFSLGFAHFFSTPSEVFPGLDRQTLLRPPSILPPNIPNRSGDVFADLLRLLQGYDVNTRDAGHRAELLRDARYFHLKGLEQKLLPCEITFNALRGKSEILLRLEDIRQSGVSFSPDLGTTDNLPTSKNNSATTSTSKPATPSLEPNPTPSNTTTTPSGTITYQRPFIDTTSHDLILEISTPESMTLDLGAMRATFTGTTKARIASLFQVIANKLNLPSMLPLGLIMLQSGGGVANLPASPANSGVSGDRVRVAIGRDAWVEVDGGVVEWGSGREEGSSDGDGEEEEGLPKIKRWKDRVDVDVDVRELGGEWVVKRGQWRLRVDANEEGKVEVSLVAVKIECFTGEVYRNGERRFLV